MFAGFGRILVLMVKTETKTIPRNTTVFLLAGIIVACLPHISYQPASVIAISGFCLGWRIAFLLKWIPAPPKFVQLVIAAAALGLILHGEHYNLGRDSGISLLIAALAIKQIQTYDELNVHFSVCLVLFVAASVFLYDHSLFAFLCVGHAVVFVALALHTHVATQSNKQSQSYGAVAKLLFYATPLSLSLFFLTPSFDGPLWELPNDAYQAQTGLSDEMSPGKISSLLESEEVAFRVTFDQRPGDIESLYWRGPVLTYFNGWTWQSFQESIKYSSRGKNIANQVVYDSRISNSNTIESGQYEVTLEPHYKNWLFSLTAPPNNIGQGFYLTANNELYSRDVITQPLRYRLNTGASGDMMPQSEAYSRRYLQMPNMYSPKTKKLVQQIQQQLDPALPYDSQFLLKVLAYLKEQPFYYSKTPPLAKYDPVDEFMIKTKTGFCEHYASAFTFMMRAAGIPARVVTGYMGGEYNPVGDYVVVRQSDAHAWAEVWLHGQGWVRVDPTSVIPPHRVDKTTNSGSPFLLAGFSNWDSAVFRYAAAWLDNLSYNWYGFLANALQAKNDQWLTWLFKGKNYVLGFILVLLSLLLAWRIFQRGKNVVDPVIQAYANFCDKLSRKGFDKSPYESASAFAERIIEIRPEWQGPIQAVTAHYNQLRYAKNSNQEVYKQFKSAVVRFRP